MSYFTAAVNFGNGKAYFFRENQYIRYDIRDKKADFPCPRPISTLGLKLEKVDAAINWGNGWIYFFDGTRYIKYNVDWERVETGYPRSIRTLGIPFDSIDAAVNWGNGRAYFFSGNLYVRYYISTGRTAPGYPLPINRYNWGGLSFTSIDAAINWGDGKVYFFKGEEFSRHNVYTIRAETPPQSVRHHWSDLVFDQVIKDDGSGGAHGTKTYVFQRMFPEQSPFIPSEEYLEELGKAGGIMEAPPHGDLDNPEIPAGYTYFGQFIDHDITFDPVSSLAEFAEPCAIKNFRTPRLELDSLYGSGPHDQPYLYEKANPSLKMLIGTKENPHGDLPRNREGIALIGDPRNDENRIISQLQLAFIKFHNKVVDKMGAHSARVTFEEVQKVVRWHYQWIVIHDFLKKIVDPLVVDNILEHGRKFYRPVPEDVYIPIEFAAAAYRFGHSMVRDKYRLNSHVESATLGDLFSQTGNFVEPKWNIEWKNFFPLHPEVKPQSSRRIDTKLTWQLLDLPFIPDGPHSLATRNLLRGRTFKLPTGQDIALEMGLKELTSDELQQGDTHNTLKKLKFLEKTPLWYYILKEAEIQGGGWRLGEVGGRIVAEVLIGLVEADPMSYLAQDKSWRPTLSTNGHFTMSDLLTFADLA